MPLFKKKAEMPTPEEIEAGKVKSYKDLIATLCSLLQTFAGVLHSRQYVSLRLGDPFIRRNR